MVRIRRVHLADQVLQPCAWPSVSLSVSAGQKACPGRDSSEPLSAFPVCRHVRRGAPEPLRLARHIRSFGWVPLTSVSWLIRPRSFALLRCLSRRLRRATTRRSMCAAMPRQGTRGPICGAAQAERRRLRQGCGASGCVYRRMRTPGCRNWHRMPVHSSSARATRPTPDHHPLNTKNKTGSDSGIY